MNINYLDRVPCHNVLWSINNSLITLEIENKGIVKRITQKFLQKPKTSYVHLDKFGSFIWSKIDGKTSLFEIARLVSEEFGEESNPLYERITKLFGTLKNYNFIAWKL